MGFSYSWVVLEVYFHVFYPIANLTVFYNSTYLCTYFGNKRFLSLRFLVIFFLSLLAWNFYGSVLMIKVWLIKQYGAVKQSIRCRSIFYWGFSNAFTFFDLKTINTWLENLEKKTHYVIIKMIFAIFFFATKNQVVILIMYRKYQNFDLFFAGDFPTPLHSPI